MPGSDWLREELTKYAFTAETMGTRPTTWFVALFKDNGDEVAAGDDVNYARQAVTFEDYTVTGRRRNDAPVTFPSAEGGAAYDVAYWGVYTASTGGEELVKQALEFPRAVAGSDVISFAIGDLVVGIGE